jgi:hypothetical protein
MQIPTIVDCIITDRGREQLLQMKYVDDTDDDLAVFPIINCNMFGVGDGEPPARAILRWFR